MKDIMKIRILKWICTGMIHDFGDKLKKRLNA